MRCFPRAWLTAGRREVLGLGGLVLAWPSVLLTARAISDCGNHPLSVEPPARGLLPAHPVAAPQSSIGCD